LTDFRNYFYSHFAEIQRNVFSLIKKEPPVKKIQTALEVYLDLQKNIHIYLHRIKHNDYGFRLEDKAVSGL
jgi:endonuclease V-like protein UPF0215 family